MYVLKISNSIIDIKFYHVSLYNLLCIRKARFWPFIKGLTYGTDRLFTPFRPIDNQSTITLINKNIINP